MIDERTRELINGELDGELTTAEQQELTGILEQSREARDYRESWQRMHSLLDDVPGQDLPRDLHERITSGIQLPAPRRSSDPTGVPALLRYGLAASLGLMVAVGFYEVRQPASDDYDSMTGTIAPDTRSRAIDSYNIDGDSLSADFRLTREDGSTILQLRLHSETTTDIDIDLSASGLQFNGLTQRSGNLDAFSYAQQQLRLRSRGQQRLSVSLRPVANAARDGGVLGVTISNDGQTVESTLRSH